MHSPRFPGTAAGLRAMVLAPILAMALATLSSAAPSPAPRPLPPAAEGDDVRDALRVLMIVSMKRALDLTPQQEMEVVPKVQRIFTERERFTRERQDAMRRVQLRLQAASVPDQEYRDAVLRLDQLEDQHRELELRLRGQIDRSLSARQQAELRLFVPRFRRQMQLQIDQARRMQERMNRGQAPPALLFPDADESPDNNEF
jgi:Spy/CpxP family protein refolding chaperone